MPPADGLDNIADSWDSWSLPAAPDLSGVLSMYCDPFAGENLEVTPVDGFKSYEQCHLVIFDELPYARRET